MRKASLWTSMVLLLALTLPLTAAAERSVTFDKAGVPSFVRGELGFVDSAFGRDLSAKSSDGELYRLSVKNFLQDFAATEFDALGTEDFKAYRVRQDDQGKVHTRFDQYLHGVRVVGAQMIVHADAETGEVYAVNGQFARDNDLPTPMAAQKIAFSGLDGTVIGTPELVYFHDSQTGTTHLTWEVRTRGFNKAGFFDNLNYLHHRTGKVIGLDPQVHTAKVRATYDGSDAYLNSQGGISGLPGVLACNESNSNCGDSSAQRAHDGAGEVYDYYQARFGRNGINGSGMTMVSSVHVDDNWANAAWYANQMVYGDGDGSVFIDLTNSFDVIAHELTHGVTDYESDLIYANESGALNEALSDIFGVSADAYKTGVINSSTWKLGEEVYTPGTSGDALRYMNDPTADGYSRDHYSTRLYPNNCTPNGNNDSCGVHGNSGIANLAYYLLVQGGLHPNSGVSPRPNVPAIGMAKAEQIFYRAQTTYLTSSSTFAAARTATVNATNDLYGATEVTAVETAWCAVGVGSCPGGGGGGGVLQNGVAKTGLSGATGSQVFYTMAVPSGASNLNFQMSGGTGDADLYVRFGSAPTTSTYDCRPYVGGNSESCPFASPQTGTYHVMIRGYSAYSGVSLVGSYTVSTPNQAPNASFTSSKNNLTVSFTDTSSDSDGTIASRSWNFGDGGTSTSTNPSHTYSSAGTYTVTLTVTDDDGATDSASASVSVTAPPTGGGALSNGVAVSVSGATGSKTYYTVTIPAGSTGLSIAMSGGSGDADLYVRLGSQPTTSTYDCRSWNSNNNETCNFATPSAGTYHIMINGYSAYSGASLVATWTEPGGSCGDTLTVTNISGSTGNQKNYSFAVDSCADTVTISTSGGSGDVDLYVRFGAAPTTTTYTCRPYLNGNNETCTFSPPQTGTYYIMLRAYSTYSGVTLSAEYE